MSVSLDSQGRRGGSVTPKERREPTFSEQLLYIQAFPGCLAFFLITPFLSSLPSQQAWEAKC